VGKNKFCIHWSLFSEMAQSTHILLGMPIWFMYALPILSYQLRGSNSQEDSKRECFDENKR
ncbi:MAG: hypothetical protein VX735_01160, partial [Pseudomonadota bacterium]|nr:hypothetical protein [Pseudomonadota bacterium]